MIHQAVLAFVHEFDRVLDRDDMVAAIFVRIIHHGRAASWICRNRSARSPPPALGAAWQNFFSTGGKRRVELFEILERKHLAGNLAEHRGDAVFLVEKIGAETGDVRDFVAEIDVAGFFETLDLIFRRDFVEHRLELVAFQRRIIHALQFAVDAQHGGVAGRKVQVRSFLLEHQIEECIDLRHMILYNRCAL